MKDTKMIDDEPEPTEEELRAAAELARALDAKADPVPGSDAAFASALRATRGAAPKLEVEAKEKAIDRAMARGGSAARARSRNRWLAIAAAALLALAIPAGLALRGETHVTTVPAAYGGRTDALFGSAIDDTRTSSERLDAIAAARTSDYFAAWAQSEEEGAR